MLKCPSCQQAPALRVAGVSDNTGRVGLRNRVLFYFIFFAGVAQGPVQSVFLNTNQLSETVIDKGRVSGVIRIGPDNKTDREA